MSQENQEINENNEPKAVENIEEFSSSELDAQEKAAEAELIVKEPVRFELSETDKNAGIELCNKFIDSLVSINLPDRLKNSEEIQNVIALQQAMERFTLSSMFKIVRQAVAALDKFDIDDCYDDMGSFDVHRLQVFMNLQSHVMATVANFNLHVRRLPQVLRDIMLEAEQTTAYIVEIAPKHTAQIEQSGDSNTAVISKLPLNVLMADAIKELNESGKADYDGTEDDFAGVTVGRTFTGELDAVGNPIYTFEQTEEEEDDDDGSTIEEI
jgi:hypothetical protein